jgi:hypothetical protein
LEGYSKEYQFLMPITVPEEGYDIYIFDIHTQKILKETAQLNVPIILDHTQVHFALPSKLNKPEKEILKIVIEKLKTINFEKSYHAKLLALEPLIKRFKNQNESVRWGNLTNVKFLAGRVFGPDDIDDIKEQHITSSKPKFKR